MTIIASDNFTDTDGTDLTAHTPSGGGSWADGPSAAETFLISDANRIHSDVGGLAIMHHSVDPSTADYSVFATLHVTTIAVNSTIGIVGRASTSANTLYLIRYNASSLQWQLAKVVAGTLTSLGTWSETLIALDERKLELRITDATKKAFIAEVERISSSDNVITAIGKTGVRSGGAGSNITGQHLDVWEVDGVAGGPTEEGTITEAAQFTDEVSGLRDRDGLITEAAQFTDTVSGVITLYGTVTEAVVFTDTVSGRTDISEVITEAAQFTDEFNPTIQTFISEAAEFNSDFIGETITEIIDDVEIFPDIIGRADYDRSILEAAQSTDIYYGSIGPQITEDSEFTDDFVGRIVDPTYDNINLSDTFLGSVSLYTIDSANFDDLISVKYSSTILDAVEVEATFLGSITQLFPVYQDTVGVSAVFKAKNLLGILQTESAQFTDSFAAPVLNAVLPENITLTDVFFSDQDVTHIEDVVTADQLAGSMTTSISESLDLSVAFEGSLAITLPTEETSFTDSLIITLGAIWSEEAQFTDSVSSRSDVDGSLIESAQFTDTYIPVGSYLPLTTEAAEFDEEILGLTDLDSSISETSDFTSTFDPLTANLLLLEESAGFTDTYLTNLLGVVIRESIAAGETWVSRIATFVEESAAFGDSFNPESQIQEDLLDDTVFGDSLDVVIQSAITAGTSFSSSFLMLLAALGILSDDSQISDDFETRIDYRPAITEAVAFSDSFTAVTSRIIGQILFDSVKLSQTIKSALAVTQDIEFDSSIQPAIKSNLVLND